MGRLFGVREARLASAFPEPPVPPYPGAQVSSSVGLGSAPDRALVVPTVWACVSLLANAVSMLPLKTYRRTSGVPQQVSNPALLSAPSATQTQSEWLHMLMVSLLLRGNAFGRIVAYSGGFPSQVELLNPDRVRVDVDRATGVITYWWTSPDGVKSDITAAMWHVRGLTLPGMVVGLSPIAYAAGTLGIDIAARQFAAGFYAGGGIPKAVIQSGRDISGPTAESIKQRVMASTMQREPLVLGQGMEYTAIQVRPEESQFLDTQQANVGQIARYFNVPAGLVGGTEGGSMTYANVEQRSIEFLTYSVQWWLRRIEDAVFPLLPQPQYCEFDTAALLRVDEETRAKVDVQLVAAKVKVPSEVRADRQLPPMTHEQQVEADMVPLTVTPAGAVKGLPGLKLPPGPAAPVPADEPQEG